MARPPAERSPQPTQRGGTATAAAARSTAQTQAASPAAGNRMSGNGRRPAAPTKPVLQADSKKLKNFLSLCVVIGGALLAMFQRPICMVLLAGLVPCMIAWLMDDSPKQRLIRTVLPLNAASALPFVLELYYGRNSMGQVGEMLGNPFIWLALYAAAILGFVLYYTTSIIIAAVFQRKIDRIRHSQQVSQKMLKEEWGEDVTEPV